jgi:hypothetical protein
MKCVFLLATVLMMLSGLGAQEAAPEKPVTLAAGSAAIADFKGEITLQAADGSSVTVQKGGVLRANSLIETRKGSLLLTLSDGSQVLVKSNSRVQLTAPDTSQGNFLQLLLGNIMAKVQKRLGIEPSFRMGTPTAVITVRGTKFSVEVTKKNKTIVEVFEGLVEVAGFAAPGSPVMIRPGFSTEVPDRGLPERPRSMQSDGGESENIRPPRRGIGNDGERPESLGNQGGESSGQGSGEKSD